MSAMIKDNEALPERWDPFQAERQALFKRIEEGIAWYGTHAVDRGKQARRLRVAALAFAFVAGLLPLVGELNWRAVCTGLGGLVHAQGGLGHLCDGAFSPIWSSIFLLLAGFMLGLEKYYGHAPAWMRFIEAQTALQTLRMQLAIDLRSIRAEAGLGKKESELLSQANKDLDQIVRTELGQWFAEFGAAMKERPAGVKA